MAYTVIGLFRNSHEADQASEKLEKADFDRTDIDVSKYRTEGEYSGVDYDYEEEEKTTSFWDRLFGDNDHARTKYSTAGARNNVVTVYTDDKDRAEKASKILDDAGAIDVDEHYDSGAYTGAGDLGTTYGMAAQANTAPDNDSAEAPKADGFFDHNLEVVDAENLERGTTGEHHGTTTDSDKVEVVKEELNVGKREIESGGVRIRSRIVERPVDETVRLRDERVYVKRETVNRELRAGDDAFKETSIEMTERKEVPVVDKTARVVEEISLGKDVSSHEEKISDTVRETEVDIEDIKDKTRQDPGNKPSSL